MRPLPVATAYATETRTRAFQTYIHVHIPTTLHTSELSTQERREFSRCQVQNGPCQGVFCAAAFMKTRWTCLAPLGSWSSRMVLQRGRAEFFVCLSGWPLASCNLSGIVDTERAWTVSAQSRVCSAVTTHANAGPLLFLISATRNAATLAETSSKARHLNAQTGPWHI